MELGVGCPAGVAHPYEHLACAGTGGGEEQPEDYYGEPDHVTLRAFAAVTANQATTATIIPAADPSSAAGPPTP